jgi:hypothetical protein
MAVTIYRSTDAGAPVLTGQAGSLTALLDACLVNGYGAKGAAGWTIAFTATNIRAYRMATGGATGFYLRVDDSLAVNTISLGREALARGYEVMTAISTGTGLFPTATQVVNGIAIRKSATNDATARPWILIADNKTFYLFTLSGDFSGYSGFAFGDFYSLRTADAYRAMIIGRETNNTLVASDATDRLQSFVALGVTAAGHYTPRQWNAELISSVLVGKHGAGQHSAAVLAGVAEYPNPYDGSLLLAQIWLHENLGSNATIKGRLRGFWHFCHPVAAQVNDGDTFAGSGALAGRAFVIIRPTPLASGIYVVETTDWDTSA